MIDIRSLSLDELSTFFLNNNEKPFRAKQVWKWLWKDYVNSFSEMTNLSESLRNTLNQAFFLTKTEIKNQVEAPDGTIKILIELFDESKIETVLIPGTNRLTVCVSTQVGCLANCSFCATASLGFKRNLSTAEIFAQVVITNKIAVEKYSKKPSNIVIMGMGEPLLNYEHVKTFILLASAEEGLGISHKKITLSTVGLPKMIKKMGDDMLKCNLALSLHAPNDIKRDKIIPFNKKHNIQSLVESLNYYYNKTKNIITLEYILIKDFNDTEEDANSLIKICKQIPSKVNIIEYNAYDGSPFKKTEADKLSFFCKILEQKGITVKVRKSKGTEISAACGQLANK